MRDVLGPRHILGAETRSRALCPNFEVVHVISADRRKPSFNQKVSAQNVPAPEGNMNRWLVGRQPAGAEAAPRPPLA